MEADASGPVAGQRILVVEDDRGIAQGLRALLSSRGYEVDLASAPETALRRLTERHYSLVVADFDLGEQDGLEVVRKLRSLHPGLPVLAVTAVDLAAATSAAEELGLEECFEKPVDPEELLRAVVRHLGG